MREPIAERRVPQDGRFKVSLKGREVDFRVSIMPSIYGEDAVLRILDKQALAEEFKGLRLEALGVDPGSMAWLRKLANEPYGILLVTGPTGSGKTTTLYAILSEIHRGHDKIITIELIATRQPARAIKDAVRKVGTRDLREAALDLVRAGETTLTQINRVTFVA